MSVHLPNDTRDAIITAFRGRICAKNAIVPFLHQAQWWAATDGAVLLDVESEDGMVCRLPDGNLSRRAVYPRPGGRARVVADLGAFKVGKSFGAAIWAAAFAAVPGARVQLIGLEYDICAPEFEYILECLLSDRGMGIKAESLQNRPRDGRMWLDLSNGARFEAKSWERKDTLKGKEIDCYLYCEAYMLPGLECYSAFSQNLRARDGYAILATTPDRPWVQELHDRAHSGDPDFVKWHCTCGVPGSANPFTFDAGSMERDRKLMTRDKFKIHHLGQLGDFVGRVYGYQRGSNLFTAITHPDLFAPHGSGGRVDVRIPAGWEVVGGADTGTYSSACVVAFSPNGDAFVIDEFPNYDYVAGSIELEDETIPEWANRVGSRMASLGGRLNFWADKNSQFKRELLNYGINLLGSTSPVEARTEITREYFHQGKIYLAPWLKVLPFEIENAFWPEEASVSGKFARVKDRDHTLDCLEHILARRPRGKRPPVKNKSGTWLESFLGRPPRGKSASNVHIGRN